MKFIFLDVDGVLNNQDYLRRHKTPYPIDPDNLTRLHKLLQYTDSTCVLHSSWRFNSNAIQYLKNTCKIPIFSIVSWQEHDKGKAIEAWLTKNDLLYISSFVILDDDNPFLEHHQPFFVQTSMEDGGLLESHILEAQRILTMPIYANNRFLVKRNEKVTDKQKTSAIN